MRWITMAWWAAGSSGAHRRAMVAVRAGATADGARVDLGAEGVFELTAYAHSREAMTEEFERRMPAMYQFVTDWLRARDVTRA